MNGLPDNVFVLCIQGSLITFKNGGAKFGVATCPLLLRLSYSSIYYILTLTLAFMC